jgi:hypothetical protein
MPVNKVMSIPICDDGLYLQLEAASVLVQTAYAASPAGSKAPLPAARDASSLVQSWTPAQ